MLKMKIEYYISAYCPQTEEQVETFPVSNEYMVIVKEVHGNINDLADCYHIDASIQSALAAKMNVKLNPSLEYYLEKCQG